MKKKTRTYLRRWTGLFLAVCVFVTMAVPALADDPFYHEYTGGETDNSHSGDNEPLGDLVLPMIYETGEGVTDFGALVLTFPDGEGGGNAAVQTGDLTVNGWGYQKELTEYIEITDDMPPVEYNYTVNVDGYGAIVRMNDDSTLDLDTGSITSKSGGVYIEVNESSELTGLTMDVNGNISTVSDAVKIDVNDGGKVTLNTQDISTGVCDSTTGYQEVEGGDGISIHGTDKSSVTVTTGNIDVGGGAVGIGMERESTLTMNINGTVTGQGLSLIHI